MQLCFPNFLYRLSLGSLAVASCLVPSLATAQMGLFGFGLMEQAGFHRSPSSSKNHVVRADALGIRTETFKHFHLSKQAVLSLQAIDFIKRDFGGSLSTTLETGLNAMYRRPDEQGTLWLTHFGSYHTKQDIELFSNERRDSDHAQRSLFLTQGWERELLAGLDLGFHVGLARCEDFSSGQTLYVPLVGMNLAYASSHGHIKFSLGRSVDGGSSLSGLYGSQLRQEASLAARWQLSTRLAMTWDCSLSLAKKMFLEGHQAQRERPLFVASAALEYALPKNLNARLGHTYRAELQDRRQPMAQDLAPITSLSLTYSAF